LAGKARARYFHRIAASAIVAARSASTFLELLAATLLVLEDVMTMRRIGLQVLAIAAGVFLAASPAIGQTCPKQSATGHVEIIGTVPGVNLGRHIIYSFSAIQTGKVDENDECVVNGEVEERLISPEGDLLRHSHLTTVCIGIEPSPHGYAARFAAKFDRSEPLPEPPPPPEIQYGIFKVVDNGEGANDPPDEGSALRGVTRANAFLHCAAGLPRPTAPSIRGNVQVQP